MKGILKFVTGNSAITPIGVAAAVLLAVLFRHELAWTGAVYVVLLIVTLAASTFERV